ncbi:MAG: iron ABC transporter permease [Erysipelothrix sp.]|nr:iron ABC transporter permease [Erysipelothrix sp.]
MKKVATFSTIFSTIWIVSILFVLSESFSRFFVKASDTWQHVVSVTLPNITSSTLILVIGTMLLTGVLGVLSAYFVVTFEFKFRRWIRFLLYFPLAIPPYIFAYVLTHFLGYTGFLQTTLRSLGLFKPEWFEWNAMVLGMIVFSMTLYPYVYISTKSFLERFMGNYVETARTLGSRSTGIFFKIALPLAMNAFIGGMVLVALEVLGDYGTVVYLNIPTFSIAIFRSWFALRDFDSALRLAGFLLIIVFIILIIEHILRKNTKQVMPANVRPLKRKQLKGIKHVALVSYFILILFFALGLPLLHLIGWAFITFNRIYWNDFGSQLFNTMFLGLVVTSAIVMIGFVIGNYTRLKHTPWSVVVSKITLLGYSIPGSVMAILVLFAFITLSQQFNLLLTTGLGMLMYGLIIRYLGLGYQNIEWGFKKIGLKNNEISQTLGKTYLQGLFQIEVPLLKSSLLAAFALVFIDVIKELPLTLNLRPFNYHTLATQVYRYAGDERLFEAAIPSLAIIFISMVFLYPVIASVNKED